ncbi:MAG: hypothetical protein ACTH32_06370 [Microbacterium gubbeenense]|uniref:hypothetical protein n=1 Tax=Microbacterium gubbeenense TaxID=159896 RepID=UPI003F9D8A9E
MSTRRILAVDPGGTTGWSLWLMREAAPIEHVEHGMIPGGVDGFITWATESGFVGHYAEWPDLTVVSETFVLDGRTRKPDVTPLKIEGALSVLFPGWVGQRNTFKSHAPDELLKAHGLWWKGAGHDRDSARHAIAYAKARKHLPTIEKFWPRPTS